jgi:hypothetical protein
MQLCTASGLRWIVFGLMAACGAEAAVIYKWTDADGVVHYSDQSVPGAEKIVTGSSSSNGIGGSVRAPASGVPTKTASVPLSYRVFAVESPLKEQVFYGDEIVPVRLGLDPELKPKQALAWQLNGAPLSEHDNVTEFTLQGLARGSYTLTATLTDLVTGDTQTSAAVNFFVRQPSELAPLRRR